MAQGITAALAALGVHVTLEWVTACMAHLTRSQPNFAAMPPKQQAGECYLQFLECDLNVAGAGCLPAGDALAAMHDQTLAGRALHDDPSRAVVLSSSIESVPTLFREHLEGAKLNLRERYPSWCVRAVARAAARVVRYVRD
jgi:hypothetical protein